VSAEVRLDHHAHCAYPFCKTPAVIYADNVIPFCRPHAEAIFRHLADNLPGRGRGARRISSATKATRPATADHPALVYYGAIDDNHIKIGCTTNPAHRWAGLRGHYGTFEVLLVEPGGTSVEVARHAQFTHLRVGQSELFRADPELMAFISQAQADRPGWRGVADEVQAAADERRRSRRRASQEQRRERAAREKARVLWVPPKENLRRLA
jgi:hypothetical protein